MSDETAESLIEELDACQKRLYFTDEVTGFFECEFEGGETHVSHTKVLELRTARLSAILNN